MIRTAVRAAVTVLVLVAAGAVAAPPAADAVGRPQAADGQASPHADLDRLLDANVRDGFVYYRALKQQRAALDRYVASLDVPAARVAAWPVPDQLAFWINGYNAIVLQTVVDAYPIVGSSRAVPANSARQIPGAFQRTRHRIGGRALTLDAIEGVLGGFGDARALLALGRGAAGSPRLRSEAYEGARLEAQLADAVRECAARAACVKIDAAAGLVTVTPIVGWHEAVFIRSFLPADDRWPRRSPIERAVAAMVTPHVFPSERAFLESTAFRMRYAEFDWRLNDLASRGTEPDGPSTR